MAKVQDLETSMALLEAEVIVITAEIVELKSNNVQLVSQEQLDSLNDRLLAAVAVLKAAE